MKLAPIVLIVVAATAVLFGSCTHESYRTTMYIGEIVNGDRNHRLYTIGSFRGQKTESLRVDEYSHIEFTGTVGTGEITFELMDSEGTVFFTANMESDEIVEETLHEARGAGAYRFRIKSERANDARIELVFAR